MKAARWELMSDRGLLAWCLIQPHFRFARMADAQQGGTLREGRRVSLSVKNLAFQLNNLTLFWKKSLISGHLFVFLLWWLYVLPLKIVVTVVYLACGMMKKLRMRSLEKTVSTGRSPDSWLQLSKGLFQSRGSWVKQHCSRDTMRNNGQKIQGSRLWLSPRKHPPTIRAASIHNKVGWVLAKASWSGNGHTETGWTSAGRPIVSSGAWGKR